MVCLNYVRKQLYTTVTFHFFCHCEISLLCHNYVIRFLKNVFLTLEMHCLPLPVHSNYLRKYDTITMRVGSSFLDYFSVVRLHKKLK